MKVQRRLFAVWATLALGLAASAERARSQSVLPSGLVKGWIFAQRMTIDSGGGRSPVVLTSRYTGSGNKVRSETSISSRALPGGAMVNIFDGDAKTTTMLMPTLNMATTSRTPTITHPDMPTYGSGGGLRQELLGQGEAILGMSTTVVRATGTRSLTQTQGAWTCTREMTVDMATWRVSDPGVSLVQLEMARGMAAAVGTTPVAAQMPEGIPVRPDSGSIVRYTSRLTMPGSPGAMVTVTTTMEVTEFRLGEVDAALFAVPAGYQVQDVSAFTSAARSDLTMREALDRFFWRLNDSTAVLSNGAKACVRSSAP